MSLPRIALFLILTLTHSGAPVVQALASAAAPDSAGMHAGHAAQPDDSSAALSLNQHDNSCVQHEACDGSCCTNCTQCFTGVPVLAFHIDVIRPELTASEHRLFFSSLISLRERPPRAFSL